MPQYSVTCNPPNPCTKSTKRAKPTCCLIPYIIPIVNCLSCVIHMIDIAKAHAILLWCTCRYKGEIRADQLQQFAADKLLELPQVPAVTRHSLQNFLAHIPQHKTTLLALSRGPGASLALRQAVQQTSMLVAAGRVQWDAEVRYTTRLLATSELQTCVDKVV